MMRTINVIICFLFISFAPIFSQTKAEKKQTKKEKESQYFEEKRKLIASGNYQFEATWARTQKGRQINLTTNPNQLKIENKEADVYLPYFGVAQNATVAYSSSGGIVFKGKPENYLVEVNDKKQKITIGFNGKGETGNFKFTLVVFKSGKSRLNVISNNRDSINYDGYTTVVKVKKE